MTQRDECRHAVQPGARDSPDAASRSTIELDLTQQRTVRRSRLFSLFPIALILTLIGNAAWEVVRTNTTGVRFSGLDRSTTFALIGTGTGLLLTRLQWARAMRPALGLSIDPEVGRTRRSTSRWVLRLMNAGDTHELIFPCIFFLSGVVEPAEQQS